MRPLIADSAAVLVLLGILTAGLWLQPSDLPQFDLCLIKKLCGLECPGCGLARAFLCMGAGRWREAASFNAGAPVLYLVFCLSLPIFFMTRGQVFPKIRSGLSSVNQILGHLLVFLLAGHWIYKLVCHIQCF